MPAFLAPLMGVFGKLLGGLVKFLPFLAAFRAGKKSAQAEVTENTLEAREEAEDAGQEVKDELREKPVGDYIRDNEI